MGTIFLKAPDSESSQLHRDDTSRSQLYRVQAISQQDAEWSLYTQAPLTYQGLYKMSVKATTVLAGQQYDGEVTYGWPKRNQEVGTTWFEFDTTGGRKKITTSIQTLQSYASPSSGFITGPPNYNGLIGVSEGKTVEGVEIVTPSLKFSVHTIMDFEDVTMDVVQFWASLTGCQNGYPMFDFDAYELLFTGCSGSTKVESISQPGVEVVFNFEANANTTTGKVGDIEGIEADGWDYVWALPYKVVDAESNQLAPKPVAAYVEWVYPVADLTQLLIPDPDDGQTYDGPDFVE